MKRNVRRSGEWLGPLWVRLGKRMSRSGRTEATKSRGRFNFSFSSFDVALPPR